MLAVLSAIVVVLSICSYGLLDSLGRFLDFDPMVFATAEKLVRALFVGLIVWSMIKFFEVGREVENATRIEAIKNELARLERLKSENASTLKLFGKDSIFSFRGSIRAQIIKLERKASDLEELRKKMKSELDD